MAHTLDIRETERELRDLHIEEWIDLALAALAIGLSLGATHAAPTLALPLFLGGVSAVILGGRAFVRRWDLCERLVLDPNAYAIPEVHARAEEAASLESRAVLARTIRGLTGAPPPYRRARVQLFADELTLLAGELEDETLRLDPLCAVRCKRLLTDAVESPLLNSSVPADGLRIAIVRIRAGFEPRG